MCWPNHQVSSPTPAVLPTSSWRPPGWSRSPWRGQGEPRVNPLVTVRRQRLVKWGVEIVAPAPVSVNMGEYGWILYYCHSATGRVLALSSCLTADPSLKSLGHVVSCSCCQCDPFGDHCWQLRWCSWCWAKFELSSIFTHGVSKLLTSALSTLHIGSSWGAEKELKVQESKTMQIRKTPSFVNECSIETKGNNDCWTNLFFGLQNSFSW